MDQLHANEGHPANTESLMFHDETTLRAFWNYWSTNGIVTSQLSQRCRSQMDWWTQPIAVCIQFGV